MYELFAILVMFDYCSRHVVGSNQARDWAKHPNDLSLIPAQKLGKQSAIPTEPFIANFLIFG